MEIGRRLLDAVLADPSSDPPRLIYADWLEEQGETERAELIRAQVEIGRLPRWDRQAQALVWRADALLARHGARWRAELPQLDGITWGAFERGFVATVRADALSALLRADLEIQRAAPVHTVEMAAPVEGLSAPVSAGALTWARAVRLIGVPEELDFGRGQQDEEPEGQAAAGEGLRTLLARAETLELQELQEYADLGWLYSGPPLARLSSLKVDGNHTAGRRFAEWIAERAGAPLTRLDLGTRFVDYDSGYFTDPTLGAPGATALVGAAPALVSLNLDRQRIGAEGWAAVAGSLSGLRSLEARAIELEALDTLPEGAPLEVLALARNPIGSRGARALATSARLSGLAVLDLDTCEIHSDGLKELVQAPFWGSLRRLGLGRNPIGSRGIELLAEAAVPGALWDLGLADCDLGASDAQRLGAVPWLRALLRLDLSANAFGPDGLGALTSLEGGGLRWLSLARTGLDAAAIADLGGMFQGLARLDLGDNPLGQPGLAALCALPLPSLEVLRIHRTGIGDVDLAPFAGVSWPALHTLDLSGNRIGTRDLSALLDAPISRQLIALDLAGCELSDSDAEVLARWPGLSRLQRLDLRNNPVGEAGLVALANSEQAPKIPDIRLPGWPWPLSTEAQRLLQERFGPNWFAQNDEGDDGPDPEDG